MPGKVRSRVGVERPDAATYESGDHPVEIRLKRGLCSEDVSVIIDDYVPPLEEGITPQGACQECCGCDVPPFGVGQEPAWVDVSSDKKLSGKGAIAETARSFRSPVEKLAA